MYHSPHNRREDHRTSARRHSDRNSRDSSIGRSRREILSETRDSGIYSHHIPDFVSHSLAVDTGISVVIEHTLFCSWLPQSRRLQAVALYRQTA